MHKNMHIYTRGEWVHSSTVYKELGPPVSIGTPLDLATTSVCVPHLSCSSPCSPFRSVFYYCMELPLPAATHRKPFTS